MNVGCQLTDCLKSLRLASYIQYIGYFYYFTILEVLLNYEIGEKKTLKVTQLK